jgi:hypothetical protein
MTAKTKSLPQRRTREYTRLEGSDAAKFVIDSGLLYHMNRVIFHPIGLAWVFEEAADGEMQSVIIDRRSNPTGVFTSKEMAIGEAKKLAYLEESGRVAMERRRKSLGFTVQPNEVK